MGVTVVFRKQVFLTEGIEIVMLLISLLFFLKWGWYCIKNAPSVGSVAGIVNAKLVGDE
jgi:hypothetical protein